MEWAGFLFQCLLLLQSRTRGLVSFSSCSSCLLSTGSIAVAHGLSCSLACGIFLDQGLNSCLLHWRVDSLPLSHQETHDKHSRIGEKWSGVQITHKEPWDYLTWITSCNEISSHRCNSKILHSSLFPQTFFYRFHQHTRCMLCLEIINVPRDA